MTRRLQLNSTVRPKGLNARDDLGQVRWAMSNLGLYDPARKPAPNEAEMSQDLQRSLTAFQVGQGLREDAVLKPGGPTEARLNSLMERG